MRIHRVHRSPVLIVTILGGLASSIAGLAYADRGPASADAQPAAPAATRLQNVLVFEKRIPSSVEPYAGADSLIARLSRTLGFSVRFTRDSTLINDDTLARYQVLIWNNIMRNVLSAEQQAAFTRYMEKGGGFIGFHAAATNRRIWPWYVDDFLGGDNHDSASIAWGNTTLYADTVERAGHERGADHPIMRGVPAAFPQYGEWYNWNPDPAANPAVTVLQWYRPKTIKDSWPAALPVSWCREYGSGPVKGRLFYTQASHMDSAYASAWYRTLAGNALRWAARDEGGSSSLAGPEKRETGGGTGTTGDRFRKGKAVWRANGRKTGLPGAQPPMLRLYNKAP